MSTFYSGERIWFNTAQAAERVGQHPVTVRKAAESGELHGSQRTVGGRWRFHLDCVDAYAAGEQCEHRRRDLSDDARLPTQGRRGL